MSYREQDGQVILTMSREDYEWLLIALGSAMAAGYSNQDWIQRMLGLTNRLNEGNPHYTPYHQVEAEKK